MAATTGRLTAITVVLLLAFTACSDSDDGIASELDAAAETAATSTTATTTPPSTTTTETPSTTLSEQDLAEAEIRQVVIDWYQAPVDSSIGDEGLRLEQTTGLLRQRVLDASVQYQAEGQILLVPAMSPIEITDIDIDLAEGTAEVDACTGSASELIDAETSETISSSDPTETATSVFQLQLVDGRWTINEWLPSGLNGGTIECEIAA